MASGLIAAPGGTGRRRRLARALVVAGAAAVLGAAGLVEWPRGTASGAGDDLRVLMAPPATLDPVATGEHGSARVIAQLYESLTAVDPGLDVRPALADSWDILDGGRRVVFHLRPGLRFSDGSALTAEDVVRSWLRIVDPDRPSPLASLMLGVRGAADRLRGRAGPEDVGVRANGDDVEVDLVRPTADFPAIVAGPTFGIVPRTPIPEPGPRAADDFVGSGGYVLDAIAADELVLRANEHYWAGPPPIPTVRLVGDLGGRSILDAYEAGDLDYTPVAGHDAQWIRYDETLGPDLRAESVPSVDYLAFDTADPPFDDVRVRRAFGQAIDWERIVALENPDGAIPATSLVPPGIPGRSERHLLPEHDPDAARRALAEAGYPGGAGFPEVTLASTGHAYAEAIVEDVERELGIRVTFEVMDYAALEPRLDEDPPEMWMLGWVADYPGANDFLGVLLGSDEANNETRWASPAFDAAIEEALSAEAPEAAARAFERAQEIVRDEVPMVPIAYGAGWALARDGLLGAHQGGLAIPRLAGFAWADR